MNVHWDKECETTESVCRTCKHYKDYGGDVFTGGGVCSALRIEVDGSDWCETHCICKKVVK